MKKSNPFLFIGRRPLFYAAILFCGFILAARFFASNIFNYISENDISRLAGNRTQKMQITGEIISEIQEKENYYHEKYVSFILRCRRAQIEGEVPRIVGGRARVTIKSSSESFAFGNTTELTGDLELPKGRQNPGGFDYREYLDRQGIHVLLFCGKNSESRVIDKRHGNFILEQSNRFCHFLSENLSAGFEERDAAFLKALLLGERSDITVEFQDLFINSDQVSIDTRERLLTELRNDLLNEVTHLYFERRRLQVEMLVSPARDTVAQIEKQLRLDELTAQIDALTGGYLSRKINNKNLPNNPHQALYLGLA